jgi:small-conductance mechanosensitive channel
MSTVLRHVARPHFLKAALATGVAIAGLVIALSSGEPTGQDLIEQLRDPTGGDIVALAGAFLFLAGAILAVRAVTRGVNRTMEAQLGDARGAPIALVVKIIGYLIVIFPTLDLVGVNVGALLLGGAITGVIVGIAAQQTLGNVFAGMVLMFVRPFVVGDDIVLRSGPLGGEYAGRVVDIGLFYVDLVTDLGPVKLPNAGVLAGAVGPGARAPQEKPEPPEEAQQT